MNLSLFSRSVRLSALGTRNTVLVVRQPVVLRRGFRSFLAPQREWQRSFPVFYGAQKMSAPIVRRSFASSNSSFNLPVRSITFFALSSLGLIGCFYVTSYSLQVAVVEGVHC